jgi:hypothetical protein
LSQAAKMDGYDEPAGSLDGNAQLVFECLQIQSGRPFRENNDAGFDRTRASHGRRHRVTHERASRTRYMNSLGSLAMHTTTIKAIAARPTSKLPALSRFGGSGK